MSKCILCHKSAGLLFAKRVSADAMRRAIAAGMMRDAKVLKFYHQFLHIDALKRVIDAGIDPDSDEGKRAMQVIEDDLVDRVAAFTKQELSKKGDGVVCRGCFGRMASYVPDLK
jgi:hypothetical protein